MEESVLLIIKPPLLLTIDISRLLFNLQTLDCTLLSLIHCVLLCDLLFRISPKLFQLLQFVRHVLFEVKLLANELVFNARDLVVRTTNNVQEGF